MPLTRSSPASRRLAAWFVAAAALPLTGLGWLGWKVVAENRAAGAARLAEQRAQALALAASALQRVLAEAEERLTAFASAQAGVALSTEVPAAPDETALMAFDRRGLLTRSGTPLPYYPPVARPEALLPDALAEADRREFGERDPAGALAVLRPLAQAADPAVRAEALLRLARNDRKRGDVARAEAAYRALASLGDTRVADLPAGLAARQGLALLFEGSGRTAELQRQALDLGAALDAGRWTLTRAQYDVGVANVRRWLRDATAPAPDEERLALAEGLDAAWREWATGGTVDASGRRSMRTPHGPVLALVRASTDRLAVLVAGRRFLEASWLAPLPSAGSGADVIFTLTDATGQPVLGPLSADASEQSELSPSATALPWTLHAISAGAPSRALDGPTRLVLGAIVMAAVLLVAGAYAIDRAISRELAAATLQSDFVSAVSHEFRTPLTTLRQLSEMLARGRVSSEARRQQFYETLLSESGRLHRLVEGLLNFGRMEAGAAEYQLERIEIAGLVHDVVAEFRRDVAGAVITVFAPAPGPPVRADRAALARALWNLLDNAVKYSPAEREVRVELDTANGHVELRVRDRGIGIPPHERPRVFDKFMRGDAARRARIQGTGVGLAMVKRIVEAHGGSVAVESVPGQGSTFTITIPTAGDRAAGMAGGSPPGGEPLAPGAATHEEVRGGVHSGR